MAVDSTGNVASETPSTTEEPCPDIGSWDDTLATPALDSCAYAGGYEQCGQWVAQAPGACNSLSTVADRTGDVCGEPMGGAQQTVVSGTMADRSDITGLSTGAGDTMLCARLGLASTFSGSIEIIPFESYFFTFYNPDMPDPNPADFHLANAYILTFAPQAVVSDPSLVKVLWDGDCLTNPNTPNPLDCRLTSAPGDNPRLKFGNQSGFLRAIVVKSGTGDILRKPFRFIGSTSLSTVIEAHTGRINLSGGISYWTSDSTRAMRYYQRNHNVSLPSIDYPMAPSITRTSCSSDGSASGVQVCPSISPPPDTSICRLDFQQSMTPDLVDEYRVYRSLDANAESAVLISTIQENGSSSYTLSDTRANPNSETYHYWITAWYQSSDVETPLPNASYTWCLVADNTPPSPPVIQSASTPVGAESVCTIQWTTPDDPGLAGFRLDRDGRPLNAQNPITYTSGITNYSYSDPGELTIGTEYSYTITSIDRGGNTATSQPVSCTPEDRRAPDRIADFIATDIPGKLGVSMMWEPSAAEDLAGYRVKWCRSNNMNCRSPEEYAYFDEQVFNATEFEMDSSQDPDLREGDYCFFMEVCDDCNTRGTCPSNNGQPNCSGFPAGGAVSSIYVKCFPLAEIYGKISPAFPQNVTCKSSASDTGIDLTWDKVCTSAAGAYDWCSTPDSGLIAGYIVILGQQGNIPSNNETLSCSKRIVVSRYGQQTIHYDRPCPTGAATFDPGATYCYNIYAITSSATFSADGAAGSMQEVCCQYNDTFAPPPPQAAMSHGATTCTVSWADPGGGAVSYNGYRCAGDSCGVSSTWTSLFTGQTAAGGLTFTDTPPDADPAYTYCVTAVDAAGNQSAVFPQNAQPNCGVCAPGVQAEPPRNVQVRAQGASGVALWWLHSLDDTAQSNAGYRIVRCSSRDCAAPQAIAGADCGDLPADGNLIVNLNSLMPAFLNSEPAGAQYYGVAFRSDCSDPATESAPAVSPVVNVGAACQGRCIHVSNCPDHTNFGVNCKPVTLIDTSQLGTDGKFLHTPAPGFEVYLANASGAQVGASYGTDASGLFHIVIDNNSGSVDVNDTFMAMLRIPVQDRSGIPCDASYADALGNCSLVLGRSLSITDSDDDTAFVNGVSLAMPGGGRAEVGNVNCDSVVNITDLVLLKAGFGAAQGESAYQTYLDFDGNGVIDVADFLVLKNYFGMELDAAPAFDATLCAPR